MPHTKRPRAASSTTSTASSSTKDLEETQQYESGLEDFDKKRKYPTNIDSVNLVMGCSKGFFFSLF